MKCSHCEESIPRNTKTDLTAYAFPCPIHGAPGQTLKRGVQRCTVCRKCHARMTADAPPDGGPLCKKCGKGRAAHVERSWVEKICGEDTKCSGLSCPDGRGFFVIAEFHISLRGCAECGAVPVRRPGGVRTTEHAVTCSKVTGGN